MNIKKAIIIGASSGIGKGISLELLKKGYKIAISARRKERLDEIKKLNPDMVIVKEYDSSKETNDELIKNLIDKLNGVDLIIYCSGIGIINKELDYSLEKKVEMETKAIDPFLKFKVYQGKLYRYTCLQKIV